MSMDFYIQENEPGDFTRLTPGQTIKSGNTIHSWQITSLWTEAQLNAIDIYKVSVDVPKSREINEITFSRQDDDIVPSVTYNFKPISLRQLRQALTQLGLREAVDTYVASQSQDVKDAYDYSTQVLRNYPLVTAALTALGKTSADADALFDLAYTL